MERVVRWVDVENRNARSGEMGSGSPWQGAALRPTGVVVFATLERPRRGTVGAERVLSARSHRAAPVSLPQQWRRRAVRSVAWLLGR